MPARSSTNASRAARSPRRSTGRAGAFSTRAGADRSQVHRLPFGRWEGVEPPTTGRPPLPNRPASSRSARRAAPACTMFKLKYHRHRGGVGETHPPERSGRGPRSASRFVPIHRWPALPRHGEPAVVGARHRFGCRCVPIRPRAPGHNLDPTMPRSATATSAGAPRPPDSPPTCGNACQGALRPFPIRA